MPDDDKPRTTGRQAIAGLATVLIVFGVAVAALILLIAGLVRLGRWAL